jgi:hypothetical protein
MAVLLVALTAAAAVPAAGATGADLRGGRALFERVRAGTAVCGDLRAPDFEHIGEYAMSQMLGGDAAFEAMDARMTAALGATGAAQMQELLGRQAAGCADAGAAIGPAMMTGGAMMATGRWSWMADGRWRSMSRADWSTVRRQTMGGHRGHGPSVGEVVLIVLGGLALLGLGAGLAVAAGRHRHHRAAGASS